MELWQDNMACKIIRISSTLALQALYLQAL